MKLMMLKVLCIVLFTINASAEVTDFRLIIGKSTEKDLEKTGCNFIKIEDNSSYQTYKTDGACYGIDGLKELSVVYDKFVLVMMTATMDEVKFDQINKTLNDKYGNSDRSIIPFVGDKLIVWDLQDENIKIFLDSPHMGFDMHLTYINPNYISKINSLLELEKKDQFNISDYILSHVPHIVGFLFILGIIGVRIQDFKYKKIPTLEFYLIHNKDCETNQGIKCKHCNSRSIRNFGLQNTNDTNRLHICNSCGKTLYRSNMTYV